MNIQTPKKMTVDEFFTWAEGRPGRYELINGVVRQMSPETVGHNKAKFAAAMALRAAVKRAGVIAHVLTDGATVRSSKDTAFEPDALVYTGAEADEDAIEICNPVIVVENASPSTRKYDSNFKLGQYMTIPSIQHILLVDSKERLIVHHRRVSATEFLATTISDGVLRLDPPGIEIPVLEFFAQD